MIDPRADDGMNYEDDDDRVCRECGGEGWIMVCIDDLCVGAGECIHGDGEALCPCCKGSGEEPQ